MIAQVAPLIRLPRGLDIFDYQIPPELSVNRGSIVVVPFRGRSQLAVVERVTSDSVVPANRLKSISRSLSKESILPPAMIDAVHYLSQEGYASLGTSYRMVLPNFRLNSQIDLRPIKKISPSQQPPKYQVLVYHRLSEAIKSFQSQITSATQRGQDAIIIAPTVSERKRLEPFFPQAMIADQKAQGTIQRNNFLKIRNTDQPVVILGTRSAIFSPVQNLGIIIFLDEESDELIQEDPSPRYDARAVSAVLAKRTAATIVLASRLPSLVSNSIAPERLSPLPLIHQGHFFVDLEEARRGNDYDILPEKTIHRLHDSIVQGGRILCIHARSSDFGSLECSDCKRALVCPQCNIPFRVEAHTLTCRYCGKNEVIPNRCPHCGSVRLRGRGRGSNHLIQELQKKFPGYVIDSDYQNNNASIIVLTPSDLRYVPEASFDRVVVSSFDSLLSIPRADAEERARRILVTALAMTKDNGEIIIQGSPLYSLVFEETLSNTWRDSQQQAAERFGYPPTWRLLQLRQRSHTRGRSISPEQVVQKIRALGKEINIIGPSPARAKSRTNLQSQQIVLRARKFSPELKKLLNTLDEGWTITPDPRELQ